MRDHGRCVARSAGAFTASQLVAALIVTTLIGIYARSVARAQSVDIARELEENGESKLPFLRARPWRWLRTNWLDEMDRLDRRLGLRVGISFTTIYQHAAGLDSPNNATVATVDVYARWKLIDLGLLGQGAMGALVRDRSSFEDLNGNELSKSVGLPWSINNSGSSGYTRLTQWWWEQSMFHRTLVLKLGRLDEPSLFDQNRVAINDTKHFMMQSLVHSQTILFPGNGAGLNVRYEPSAGFYATAGFGDANGDPDRRPREGISSFGKGEYFEAGEIGVSPNLESLWAGAGQGTYRLMGWHTAATSDHSSGSGFALSFDQDVGKAIVPFLRFGYCPDDVFKTSLELSWGVEAINPFGRSSDRSGIGASWGKPVASASRDQFAAEIFYRLEVVEGVSLSADAELVFDPALQPDRDFVAVLGVRTRLSL